MPLDITIAGTKIPTELSALKSFPKDKELAFSLDSKLSGLLDSTLERVPASTAITSVAYTSPAAAWCPVPGSVQFGLQGGVTGSLQIMNSGTLVTYTDGLDQPQSKAVLIPAGTSYVSLTLKFNISANASGTYSNGAYGVKAALDTTENYAIQFSKAFAPSTVVREALAQVFESFVLPLHQETVAQMANGDCLLHEFDGNLHLSFGAYAGLDKVLYAGQATVDVLKSFDSSLALLTVTAKPEVKAGASLDFKFSYAARFEACLLKLSSQAAKLHLYRSATAATATTLQAGLTFDTTTTATVTGHTQQLQDSIVNAAGGPNTDAGNAVSKVVSAGASEIAKYVAEGTDKLTAWVNKADAVHTNLQVAIETSRTRTILAGYDFDLTSAAFPVAWQAAIGGDFLTALATGAVTLDIGSGLEQAYQLKTSFACNFFNMWSMKSWEEFSSKVTLVYAGNNIFHLVANIGRSIETQAVGAMHSLNFYFTANADVSAAASAAGQTSHVEVDLHLDLAAQADAKAMLTMATLVSAMAAGPTSDALARDLRAFATNARQGTALLQVTIAENAYAKIHCDPYADGKPTGSGNYDEQNWTAFAKAADDLNTWPLPRWPWLESFASWVQWNTLANGSSIANRLESGSRVTWPDTFPATEDVGTRGLIANSMLAGQSFMNFCADLRDLVNATDTNAAGISWNGLVKMVTNAIKADVNIDFARPAALAIIRLCGTQGAVISGPTPATVPANHFAVSIRLV